VSVRLRVKEKRKRLQLLTRKSVEIQFTADPVVKKSWLPFGLGFGRMRGVGCACRRDCTYSSARALVVEDGGWSFCPGSDDNGRLVDRFSLSSHVRNETSGVI